MGPEKKEVYLLISIFPNKRCVWNAAGFSIQRKCIHKMILTFFKKYSHYWLMTKRVIKGFIPVMHNYYTNKSVMKNKNCLYSFSAHLQVQDLFGLCLLFVDNQGINLSLFGVQSKHTSWSKKYCELLCFAVAEPASRILLWLDHSPACTHLSPTQRQRQQLIVSTKVMQKASANTFELVLHISPVLQIFLARTAGPLWSQHPSLSWWCDRPVVCR